VRYCHAWILAKQAIEAGDSVSLLIACLAMPDIGQITQLRKISETPFSPQPQGAGAACQQQQ